VHTLEAAKALLAAQAAATPPQVEEAYDDEDPFDIETESEIETEETEGLSDEASAGEETAGEGDGHRRKRRRRRRGRGGEARDGAPPRDDNEVVRAAMSETAESGITDEGETEEDGSEEQPGLAHAEGSQNGERRPRRRGRRGGRRRRGEKDDGLAGSIADELAPPPGPEAESAVADFDRASEPAPSIVRPEPVVASPEPRPAEPVRPEAFAASTPEETAAEAEKTARRRSTVREKVSFLASPPPDTAPAMHSAPGPAPAPAPAEAAPADESDQPRKAGWWSRRFGNGE